MTDLWIILPPWVWSVAVTLFGRWIDQRWVSHASRPTTSTEAHQPITTDWRVILVSHLAFLSLLPIAVLSVIHPIIPFSGSRAGLAMGLAAFLFGMAPMRLIEARAPGWNVTLWRILIDLLRVGGALTLAGWLVSR
jgi:hypothetical protein